MTVYATQWNCIVVVNIEYFAVFDEKLIEMQNKYKRYIHITYS